MIDKLTGKPAIGLCTSSQSDNETEHGWAGQSGIEDASTAMISLDGKKSQTFILPLYVDYFRAVEGEYNLRVTVFGNGQEKIQEVPITIAKKRSMGLFAVGFSFLCFLIVCLNAQNLKKCIFNIGAKGAITIICSCSIWKYRCTNNITGGCAACCFRAFFRVGYWCIKWHFVIFIGYGTACDLS